MKVYVYAVTGCFISVLFLCAQNTECELEWPSEAEDVDLKEDYSSTSFSGIVRNVTQHVLYWCGLPLIQICVGWQGV